MSLASATEWVALSFAFFGGGKPGDTRDAFPNFPETGYSKELASGRIYTHPPKVLSPSY
jgi:hypothetical protein